MTDTNVKTYNGLATALKDFFGLTLAEARKEFLSLNAEDKKRFGELFAEVGIVIAPSQAPKVEGLNAAGAAA